MLERERKNSKARGSFEIYKSLKDFSDLVSFFLEKEIRKHGITPSQFFILKAIKEKKPGNQKQLGECLIHTGGNITVVSKLLEKKKLIKRVKLQDDKRFFTILITPLGESKFSEVEKCCKEILDQLMSHLTVEESDKICDISQKMIDLFASERLKAIRSYTPRISDKRKKKKK
ncbi:MAG: MarR family winged helix-turn-helix transcriptional regulator [Acidobacteria bacterium]|nr:MarR family winged helix-turn-helix transcriptional regulator [Acidobacteriota bacterium]